MNMYHPDPYYIAGKVCLVKGTMDCAEKYVKKALEFSPSDPVYIATMEEIKARMQTNPKLPHQR
jgi:hypothetical protein